MTIVGPAVVDLTQHFVERWNFVKHDKYKHDERYESVLSIDLPHGTHEADFIPHPLIFFSWLGLPSPYQSPVDAFESRRGSLDEEQAEARRAERRREHPHLQEWMDVSPRTLSNRSIRSDLF